MSLFNRLKGLVSGGFGDVGPAAIPCEDALRRVQEFLDGELKGATATEVEDHLEACERCYPHLRLERRFRTAVRRAAGGEVAPPELQTRLAALISEARSEG